METNTPEVAPIEDTPTEETGVQETSQPTEEPTGQPPEKADVLSTLDGLDIDTTVKEELRKGYMRQSDYTRKTQELSDLKKSLAPQQGYAPATDPTASLLDQYYESKTAPLEQRLSIAEFAVAHPDAAELEPIMVEILETHPNLRHTSHLNALYELAQARSLQSKVKTAKDEGVKEALTAIKAQGKTSAEQTTPRQAASTPDVSKMSSSDILEMIGA